MQTLLNVFQILFLWVWTVISAIFGFIILPVLGQKRAIYISTKVWSIPILWVTRTTIVLEGVENIPLDRHVIYASNHESSFDIPALFKVFPVPLFFIAKAELKKIPLFGWFVGAVGMVFIERKDHESALNSLQKAGDEIGKGKNIISFPEGTRSRDGKLLLFKRGTFVLALENQIDVVPVTILGSHEVNPPGYKVTKGTITIKVGKPISISDFDAKNSDVLAKFVEDRVREMRL